MKYISAKKRTLEDDGFMIIENVITPGEIDMLRDQMWEYLNHMTKHTQKPIAKDDTSTYRSFFELYPKHGMLLQHWSVGHNPMSWYVRQRPRVIDVFSKIWKTDDLLTSFDGLSISLPCEITNRGWYRGNSWLHCDQSFMRNDFECVQGQVNLYDVNEGDATLRLLCGSHKYHKILNEKFQLNDKGDWHKLSDAETQFLKENGCEDVCLTAPRGSLILWDSRLIHEGMIPMVTRKKLNIRCALYVCMTPRRWATNAHLKKKMRAFTERRTTSHYPHKIKLFPKHPRTYGGPLPAVDEWKIEETPLMKVLSGFDRDLSVEISNK